MQLVCSHSINTTERYIDTPGKAVKWSRARVYAPTRAVFFIGLGTDPAPSRTFTLHRPPHEGSYPRTECTAASPAPESRNCGDPVRAGVFGSQHSRDFRPKFGCQIPSCSLSECRHRKSIDLMIPTSLNHTDRRERVRKEPPRSGGREAWGRRRGRLSFRSELGN